jgi:hypothetical protein
LAEIERSAKSSFLNANQALVDFDLVQTMLQFAKAKPGLTQLAHAMAFGLPSVEKRSQYMHWHVWTFQSSFILRDLITINVNKIYFRFRDRLRCVIGSRIFDYPGKILVHLY